jgi:hypothetical protein
MTRLASWFLIVLLFGGFGLAVVHLLRTRAAAGRGLPPFSVYSAERDGLRPCAQFLRHLDWTPLAVTRPVPGVDQRGLLLVVEPVGLARFPDETPDLPEVHVQALLRWVERGNTLLLCGRRMNGLHRALDVTLTTDEASPNVVHKSVPGEAGGYTEEIRTLLLEGRHTVRAEGALPLWWFEDGRAGALLLRRGRGRVLVVADPSLLTVRGLHRADNAMFLYNVAALHAQDGRVYFDEYHHGLRSAGGFWGYLHHHDQLWALAPVLVVVLAAIWAVGVRLGPAVPRVQPPAADGVAYAAAVARIYERSGARRLLARTLARDFLAGLTRSLRLRRSALPAEVLAAWRQHHPGDEGLRLQRLLRGLGELRKGQVNDRQLLAWAQAFDDFLAEVRRAR